MRAPRPCKFYQHKLAVVRVSLFPGFSTLRETRNFQKNIRKFRGIFGIPKIFGIGEIFSGNFFELEYFEIFSDFQHFRSNF